VLDRGRIAKLGAIEELGGVSGIADAFRQTHERDKGQET